LTLDYVTETATKQCYCIVCLQGGVLRHKLCEVSLSQITINESLPEDLWVPPGSGPMGQAECAARRLS